MWKELVWFGYDVYPNKLTLSSAESAYANHLQLVSCCWIESVNFLSIWINVEFHILFLNLNLLKYCTFHHLAKSDLVRKEAKIVSHILYEKRTILVLSFFCVEQQK